METVELVVQARSVLAAVEAGVAAGSAVTDLSVATIRRLACDAEIIPAVLGSPG